MDVEGSSSDEEWDAELQPREADVADQSRHLSQARHSPFVWVISCRPVSHMKHFSEQTLMFHPDTRLFCHNGTSCTVSNARHLEQYCHLLPPKETTAEKTESNPFGIPNADSSWLLQEGRFSPHRELDDLPRNAKVAIFVHGHRTRFYKFTSVLRHLETILVSKERPATHVVGFLWPCHGNKVSYALAKKKATTQAAHRLRAGIDALLRLGNTVTTIAHSMGAHVALSALRQVEVTPFEEGKLLEALLLVGAAIPSDAFESDYQLETISRGVKRIINFNSLNDSVLSTGFSWGEALSNFSIFSPLSSIMTANAMGLSGISGGAESDRRINVRNIDISAQVGTHSVHAYLASDIFRTQLLEIVIGDAGF